MYTIIEKNANILVSRNEKIWTKFGARWRLLEAAGRLRIRAVRNDIRNGHVSRGADGSSKCLTFGLKFFDRAAF